MGTEFPLNLDRLLASLEKLFNQRQPSVYGDEPVSYTHLDVYKRQVSAYLYLNLASGFSGKVDTPLWCVLTIQRIEEHAHTIRVLSLIHIYSTPSGL